MFNLEATECPYCHAKKLEDHDCYTRRLITAENIHILVIERYKCPICDKTHALLPDIIIPYSPYSLRFKLDAVIAYSKRTVSVEKLCAQLGIAISTLYRWLEKFKEHKALYLGILKSSETIDAEFAGELRHEKALSHMLKQFFTCFGISLWQMQTTLANQRHRFQYTPT